MITLKELGLRFWKSGLALALGMLAVLETPSAQCPAPDKLDGGPCCAQAQENIPWFKQVTQPALDICYRDCGVEFVGNCRARWTPLHVLGTTGVDCGYRAQRLDLFDPVGNLKWTGVMRLAYSRTWQEADPSGVPLQVWRFLVNGDLRATSIVGPAPCPLPTCAGAFGNRVKVSGYIDFAQACVATGPPVQIAWMLAHACDTIDHAPGFPRAGVFHPERSYAFVGPAAGFVPTPLTVLEGTPGSMLEAMRRLRHPAPGTTGPITCEFEERLNHFLGPVATFCLCATSPPLSAQWLNAPLNLASACGSTLVSPGPFLPGYLSMGIGRWTAPGTFPGVEDVRWNAGSYIDSDPCTGIARNVVAYGATTLGGFPATQVLSSGIGGPLPLIFLDQADAIRTGGGPVMNVPYLSELILNLNH